jgi:hypothetical protein
MKVRLLAVGLKALFIHGDRLHQHDAIGFEQTAAGAEEVIVMGLNVLAAPADVVGLQPVTGHIDHPLSEGEQPVFLFERVEISNGQTDHTGQAGRRPQPVHISLCYAGIATEQRSLEEGLIMYRDSGPRQRSGSPEFVRLSWANQFQASIGKGSESSEK